MTATDWSADIFAAMAARGIGVMATVPDAGLSRLIRMGNDAPETRVITLTTEEEGVGILTGLWAGGRRGLLAMQSSGVGNCVNALSLPAAMRAPCLLLVTMRGEWGEGNPWQVPMSRAVEPVLRAMGVLTLRAERAVEVGETFAAAADIAWESRQMAAVLVGQRVIGSKRFQ